MNHSNVDFAHIKDSSHDAFADIAKIMCTTTLLFSCSQKSNALYNSDDIHHFIMSCCLGNSYYSESTAKKLKMKTQCIVPSGSWIRKQIAKIPQDKMTGVLSDGIDRTISHLKKLGMLQNPVTVAIDKHLICRYDKTDSPYLIKCKRIGVRVD